jgi:hypothetical protein
LFRFREVAVDSFGQFVAGFVLTLVLLAVFAWQLGLYH